MEFISKTSFYSISYRLFGLNRFIYPLKRFNGFGFMFDDIQHVYAVVFDGKFANNYKMTMRKIQMDQYANLGGDSGVVSYLITGDSILVEFKGGWKYLYNSVKPGTGTVEQMKELARQGRGLNSFISRMVKGNFASKSR